MEDIDARAVAKRLGRSLSWFYAQRAELERAGFPPPLPVTRRWNATAIDAWRGCQSRMPAAAAAHVADKELDALFGP